MFLEDAHLLIVGSSSGHCSLLSFVGNDCWLIVPVRAQSLGRVSPGGLQMDCGTLKKLAFSIFGATGSPVHLLTGCDCVEHRRNSYSLSK
jgi:hypothetical protein